MSLDFAKRSTPDRAIKLALFAAVALGGCSGCGSSGAPASVSTLVPAKGKVTFKGQPLTSGTIRFEPDDFGRAASGTIQPDGSFVLSTLKDGDGVVPGHHRVSITNLDPKSKAAAVPKKQWAAAMAKLEADVSADKTEYNFDIP
jgi:hypothetical protein